MKEIAKGVFDATDTGVYEVSEDGKTVTVKSGVFVLEDVHVEVKKHVEADSNLIIGQRVTRDVQLAASTGGKTPMPKRYQGSVSY